MKARVIMDHAASGAWNMALDEACLEFLAAGQDCTTHSPMPPEEESSPVRGDGRPSPVLRIYRWQPATLSLGYFQAWSDRQQHPASQACPLVRRRSGGGAILHDHELTYSVVVPAQDHLDGDLQQRLYNTFHLAFQSALRRQEIETSLAQEPQPEQPFLCFQRRSPGDVICRGFKIVGSAQRRRKSAILQHGSVLLRRSESAPELPGIAELAGAPIDQQDFLQAWLRLVAQELGWKLESAYWAPQLIEHAKGIEQTRYGSSGWNRRR